MLPEGGGSQGGLGGMPFCPGWNEAVGARLQAAPVLCKAFSRVETMMKVRDQMPLPMECYTSPLQNYFTWDSNELLSHLAHCYVGFSVFVTKSDNSWCIRCHSTSKNYSPDSLTPSHAFQLLCYAAQDIRTHLTPLCVFHATSFCMVIRKLSLYWNKNSLCFLYYLRVLSRKHSEVSVIRYPLLD